MEIKFNLCGAKDVKIDLANLKKFKKQYIEIITKRSSVDGSESDLEQLGVIVDIELLIERLFESLKEAEEKELKIQKHEN